MKTRRTPFSLIELLIVISIIGMLTYLMLPKYGSMEQDAKKAISAHNAAALSNFLANYQAANGALPSRLHTGLNEDGEPLESLPTIFTANLNNTVTDPSGKETTGGSITGTGGSATDNRFAYTLARAGIVEVMYGLDSEITSKTVNDGIDQNPDLKLIRVNGDWYNNFIGAGNNPDINKPVIVNGMTLGEWISTAPLSGYGGGSIPDAEKFAVYAFFIGKDVLWGRVFNADGSPKKASRANIELKKNVWEPGIATFNYPIVFLKMYKSRPAEIIGTISFAEGGRSFEGAGY